MTLSGDINELCARIEWASKYFDEGRHEMALRIAFAARSIFHDFDNTPSLISSYHIRRPIRLVSTTALSLSDPKKSHPLGLMGLSPSGFRPFLEKSPRSEEISLQLWWHQEAIISLHREPERTITRKQLVLAATNIETDRETFDPEDFCRLQDGLGFEIVGSVKNGPSQKIKLLHAEYAALRQLGHEILSSPDIRVIRTESTQQSSYKEPPSKIHIESEMNRYVRAFGGNVVKDLVGPSPLFDNADYAFKTENLVAELKCLSEDKSEDTTFEAKIQKLFDSWLAAGRIPDPGPGEFTINSASLAPDLQRELYQLFARPLRAMIKKANKQIRETKAHLNMPDAYGLLLLANDGNFRLEPAQLKHALDLALGNLFSSIDGLVIFTANMLATSPASDQHMLIWMPGNRVGHPPIPHNFLDPFCEGWFAHLSALTNETLSSVGPLDISHAEAIRYEKRYSSAGKRNSKGSSQ